MRNLNDDQMSFLERMYDNDDMRDFYDNLDREQLEGVN